MKKEIFLGLILKCKQYSDNLATPGTEFRAGSIEDTPLLGKTQARKLSKPWEDPEVIARDHRNRSKMSAWAESSGARRSLADQIATGRATDNNLNPDLVMDFVHSRITRSIFRKHVGTFRRIKQVPRCSINIYDDCFV